MMRTSLKCAALGLLAAASVAACSRTPSVEVPAEGVVQLSDQFTSEFALVGADGQPVSSADFRGKVMVVYFGFASCPDVCPMALGRLSAALNELTDKERAAVAPVFITVDPERDTPETLKAYLAFDERITGLTGSPAAIDAARQSFKVYAKKEQLPGSALGYTMNHTSLFYLVDRKGAPKYALHDSLNAQELAEMLRRSVNG